MSIPARQRALLLALLAWLCGPSAGAAERIREFRSDVALASDGSFAVEERIVYDFGSTQKHGIYREIPVRYGRGSAPDYRIALDVESVVDRNGREWPWRVRRSGEYARIRIGDADRTVTGVQEYRIRYRVRRGILWFDDHDELYWNATGTEWKVPIDRADVTVRMPGDGDRPEHSLCFTGPRGSVETACALATSGDTTLAESRRPFRAGEGLTVVIALPKGVLDEPSRLARLLDRAGDYLSGASALPFVAFFGLLAWWRRHGRDPRGAVAVPVRYEPPEGMTPAEMGTVLDERVDTIDVTATILDLAVRGHLQIEETEAQGFLFLSQSDYALHKGAKPTDALKPHERKVLSGLFASADSVKLSEQRNKFYKRLPGIRDALYAEVAGRGWFPTSPDAVRKRWAWIALGIAIPAAIAAMLLDRPDYAISLGACGAVGLFWSRHMPRATAQGRRAKQHIQGFQEFLERVEQDRLERLGLLDVAKFESILPYAFVLGAADAWAEAFAGLYTEPPQWYVSHSGGPFRPRGFVDRVGRSLDTMGNVMTSQPRGSGSSGFGGSGSSGGGFGGGGGGSW